LKILFLLQCDRRRFQELPAAAAWFLFKTNSSENPPLIISIWIFCLDSEEHYRYSSKKAEDTIKPQRTPRNAPCSQKT
jgi:hypothetical protein